MMVSTFISFTEDEVRERERGKERDRERDS